MYYYQFNIGDYKSHTSHLTIIEDLAYRRLLDLYYLSEKMLPSSIEAVARKIGMSEYLSEVEMILLEFFEHTEPEDDGFGGWFNKRADAEIAVYKGFSDAGKRGAAKRWGTGGNDKANSPPIAPPIANTNQEPITNKQEKPIRAKRADVFPEIDNRQIVDDWLKIRKLKKLAVTETAIVGFKKEVELSGWSLNDALIKCCHEGWGGFKAAWVKDESKPQADGKFDVQEWLKTK